MAERVVVTGLGPVTSIGSGTREFWDALVAGRSGFGPITRCDASDSPSKIASEVKDFRLERYIKGWRGRGNRLPRAVQFALAAGALALQDAGLEPGAVDPDRCGVHVGTSVGNLGETFLAHRKWLDRELVTPPHLAFHLFHHAAACLLSSHFDLRGPIQTVSSGCNSGLDALGLAMPLIAHGVVDAMLVVGTDCQVTPEILAALNASHSLTTRFNDNPVQSSRPFDRDRDGTVNGEGAAALVLESESHARARGARVYAHVAGYASRSAGKHRAYSHDEPEVDVGPAVRAFQGAMAEAGWKPEDVDLFNANGSSSVVYDRLEARALAETFDRAFATLPVHSIKSMLGQHGAGSLALQAAVACLSIYHGVVPPTLNHEIQDPECGAIRIVTAAETLLPRRVLVHSIGLGGFYYSCAAFERAAETVVGDQLSVV